MATVEELLRSIRHRLKLEQNSCLYATLKKCTVEQLLLVLEARKAKELSEWDVYDILFPGDVAENEKIISAIVEPFVDKGGEKCPKCGRFTLHLLVSGVQTRAGDEAQSLVKRCRCGYRKIY